MNEGNKKNKVVDYSIVPLTFSFASKHAEKLAEILDQIPQVSYGKDDILAESKDEGKRIFHGKWDHSFVAVRNDQPIGLIIGYEREAESNDQYPTSTIYISELGVDPNFQRQGVARELIQTFLRENQKIGMIYLDGGVNFSIQTNSAEWNEHVRNLYKSFGFNQRATKNYDNRTDVILSLANDQEQ